MNATWQVDFYRLPDTTEWEFLACDGASGLPLMRETCNKTEANATWLGDRLKALVDCHGSPERLAAFRPQTVGLLREAARQIDCELVATRRVPALKQQLQARSQELRVDLLTIEQLPPRPLPDDLQGDRWRFASVAAGEFALAFGDRPIPFQDLPAELLPLQLGLASDARIPGVAIEGGRRAWALAQWLMEVRPVALDYLPAETPDTGGLILTAGLDERWVLNTFDDAEMAEAARTFRSRQSDAQGLHFLLVRPDDSGMTDTGIFLLQQP